MNADKTQIERAVLSTQHLPPLSLTATRLLQAISDDDVDLKALAEIIEQDPALTARIVGLANSAYFSQTQPVFSVEEAIIRVLGLDMVKSLALGLSVAGVFNVERCPSFDLTAYWYQALATGQLVRSLCAVLPFDQRPDPNLLYLGGLFHNLGALLLVHVAPEPYTAVLASPLKRIPEDLYAAERQHLGVDRLQAGHWLMTRWHLPQAIRDLMANFADPGYSGDRQAEQFLLNAAAEWVLVGQAAKVPSLGESVWLEDIEGIDRERLSQIEETFRAQQDELRLMAGQLA